MKKRTCVRMDKLNEEQAKDLNTRLKDVVEDFNEEVKESQENQEDEK